AYVFTRTGAEWSQQQKLLASDPEASDSFGYAVGISGNTAIVSGHGGDDNGGQSGSAYVFTETDGVWSEQQKLLPDDGMASDSFGFSVGISGNTAIVGADLDDHDGGSDAGSAYVFTRSGGTWSQQQKLLADDGAAGDNFGWSVSISDDMAIVGAVGDDYLGANYSGSAYEFKRNRSGSWTQVAKLSAPDRAGGEDKTGIAVAIEAGTAILGAREAEPFGSWSGAAYAFVLDADGDGITDEDDDLPLDPSETLDTDGDGIGNNADPDDDGDGLSDDEEALAYTDPLNPDSDFDGLLDGVETNTGSYVSPTDTGSDPLNSDTDFDGYGDGEEVNAGTDPTDGSVPGPVAQALAVYPSPGDDGLPGEAIEVRGTALVPVYFNNGLGSNPLANQCTDFGGNEVCGWTLELGTTGDLLISGIDWEGTVSVVGDPTTFLVAASTPDVGGWEGATRIATVAVTGTLGELRLLAQGDGFVDRFGAMLAFPEPEGVLLAQASPLPWKSLAVADGRGCGVLGNGSLQCFSATGVAGYASPPTSGTYRKVVTGPTPPECAIDLDGNAQCWGAGAAAPSGSYLDLVAGNSHRCGLFMDGEAECWDAANGNQALGSPAPGPFQMLTRGGLHVCGLRTDGSVVCWGDNNDFGQVMPLPEGTFEALAGGTNHNCGIRPGDGSAECWGDPSDGKTATQAGPFVAISAGSDHTCGIGDDGLVTCWGADALGQLAAPGDAFIALSATASFTCGITDQAEILCWGDVPSGFAESIPVLAYPRVAAGTDHACGIAPSGEVSCQSAGTAPTPVPPGAYRAVASGRDFSVLIDPNLGVAGFGEDSSGQTTGLTPARFALQIAAGEAHACQLLLDHSVECWGDLAGALANGTAQTF
ncbi:MAG: hypothetical protein AAEJ53_07135, partial [Myxococcota bacterium]